MDDVWIFKSINMGRELEIAGDFIYESTKRMIHFEYIHDHFDINAILYFGSVGIERLQKILICLSEPDLKYDEILEKKLKGHHHLDLQENIKPYGVNIEKNEMSLLGMFQEYYENHRYGEFDPNYDHNSIIDLFSRFLSITGKKWDKETMLLYRDKIVFRKFYINVLGNLTSKYYKYIREKAFKLGVYTYEINYDSNASRVYWLKNGQLYDEMEMEQLSFAELLVYLYKTKEKEGVLEILNDVESLNLDSSDLKTSLDDILRYKPSYYLTDLVREYYTDFSIEELNKRKTILNLIADKDVMFFNEDE